MQLIKYEIRNTLGNIFSIIFGVIFPILLTILIFKGNQGNIPEQGLQQFKTIMFVSNLLMGPLAMIFVGFAALFSQEIQKGVNLRMLLFGVNHRQQITSKFIAQMLVIVLNVILYSVIIGTVLHVPAIDFKTFIVLGLAFTIFSFCLFLMAYAISLLAKKFSITYGITMSIYFGTMILSGMMGIRPENFPKFIRVISDLLPTTHIVDVVPKLWTQQSVSFAPMIQSFLFIIAITGTLTIIALRKKH